MPKPKPRFKRGDIVIAVATALKGEVLVYDRGVNGQWAHFKRPGEPNSRVARNPLNYELKVEWDLVQAVGAAL